jgi:lipoprotein-anchoring transpeptidase ErfK/SrfK
MEPNEFINEYAQPSAHHWKKSLRFTVAFISIVLGGLGMAYSLQAYPEVFRSGIVLSKSSDIQPQETLIVSFSQPVLAKYYEGKIQIVPDAAFETTWSDDFQKLAISPKIFWQPETRYQLILPEGRNRMYGKVLSMTAEFTTASLPKVTGITPRNGAQDVVIDIEDPISVDFDKSTRDYYLKFVIDPFEEVAYQNNLDKTQFQLMPKQALKGGQHYSVKVYAKFTQDTDENYKLIHQSSFDTLPPPPQNWDKDFTVRLEQAKKYTWPQITTGKYIDVNLASQVMTIFEDGKLLDAYMVSTGKPGMPTPTGNWEIHNKAPRVWSKAYGLYMPYWMAVAPDGKFGIHELPEWPGGYKEGANHLGTPVSHGCIRLGVGPAQRVYEWAEVGTKVAIH